jgi:hypothetical protein
MKLGDVWRGGNGESPLFRWLNLEVPYLCFFYLHLYSTIFKVGPK